MSAAAGFRTDILLDLLCYFRVCVAGDAQLGNIPMFSQYVQKKRQNILQRVALQQGFDEGKIGLVGVYKRNDIDEIFFPFGAAGPLGKGKQFQGKKIIGIQ